MPIQDTDDLDDEERTKLARAIDAGIAAARAGDHADAEDLLEELRARG